jgi:chitinase
MSSAMVGVDFDIEGVQTQQDIMNLVNRVKVASKQFPSLRFSFTLATLGGTTGGSMFGQSGKLRQTYKLNLSL